jgi:hypothetical protein
VTDLAARRVAPFGHPGITARVQLPQAYRSLPRPSSPLDAKASTVCLIAFDLKFGSCRPAHAMRVGLLGVDLRVPDAASLAADRVVTPSGASIVKERKEKRAGGARGAGDF